MPSNNGKNRIKDRQDDAKKRQAESDGRSAADQLKRLDKMFGKGKGAAKERARLATKINV